MRSPIVDFEPIQPDSQPVARAANLAVIPFANGRLGSARSAKTLVSAVEPSPRSLDQTEGRLTKRGEPPEELGAIRGVEVEQDAKLLAGRAPIAGVE